MQQVIEKSGQMTEERIICPQMQEIAESHRRYVSLVLYPGGDFSIYVPKRVEISDPKHPAGDNALMGLSTDANLHKAEKLERGALGLSSFAKKMIRSGAALMEKRYGHSNISFLTLTCPFVEQSEIQSFNGGLSKITNRFIQGLTRHLEGAGGLDEYVYCIEPQSRGAMHIHLLFIGRVMTKRKTSKYIAEGPWLISPSQIDSLWKRTLQNEGFKDVDVKAACNVQAVKKSAVSYMSKYLSKGPKAEDGDRAPQYEGHPSAWWGCSYSLKNAIKEATISEEIQIPRFFSFLELSAYLEGRQEVFYSFPILTEELQPVGLCGRCKPSDLAIISDFIHSVITGDTDVF